MKQLTMDGLRPGSRRGAKAVDAMMPMSRATVTRITRIVFLVWLVITAGLLWKMMRRPVPSQNSRPRTISAEGLPCWLASNPPTYSKTA